MSRIPISNRYGKRWCWEARLLTVTMAMAMAEFDSPDKNANGHCTTSAFTSESEPWALVLCHLTRQVGLICCFCP